MRIYPPDGTLRTKLAISPDITIIKSNDFGEFKGLPWHLSEENRFFKNATAKNIIVVGRKTHETLLELFGHPFTGCETMVMTRKLKYEAAGCRVVESEKRVLAIARHRKVFVIGGDGMFKLFLPYAKYLVVINYHASKIESGHDFPYNRERWTFLSKIGHNADTEKGIPAYSINTYVR